jgi:ribosomal protein L21E
VEVDGLNEYARALHQRRGALGPDQMMKTAAGAKEFATGDRVQFTGNGTSQREKNAGLTNGRVGTVTEIDTTGAKPRVTVQLDTAKGKEPQSVSFTVGEDGQAGEFNRFKHGYAGTIYRGQGKTLDQTYVCHSSSWKSSAAYVALTRHRESVEIFAARETVKDLDAMAKGMGRKENKRAATVYQIDAASAARVPSLAPTVSLAPQKAQGAARPAAAPIAAKSAGTARGASRGVAREAFDGRATSRAAEGIGRAAAGGVAVAAKVMSGLASLVRGLAWRRIVAGASGASQGRRPHRDDSARITSAAAPPPHQVRGRLRRSRSAGRLILLTLS